MKKLDETGNASGFWNRFAENPIGGNEVLHHMIYMASVCRICKPDK